MAVAAMIIFAGFLLLSIEKNDHGQWEFAAVSVLAGGGESGGGTGNWAAEYPPCENTISVGVPPLVYTTTVRGTYRDCVAGSGVCLYSDIFCCINRLEGVCLF